MCLTHHCIFIQCVPLATEPGISLIILPLMRILQRNLKRTTDTFLFTSHTTNVFLFKFRFNIFIGVRIIKYMPGSVASGTHCIRFQVSFPLLLMFSEFRYIDTFGRKCWKVKVTELLHLRDFYCCCCLVEMLSFYIERTWFISRLVCRLLLLLLLKSLNFTLRILAAHFKTVASYNC